MTRRTPAVALFRARLCLLVMAAFRLVAHGPAHERIAAITEALERDPANAGLLLSRAELRRTDGDLTNALADLRLAARADSSLAAVDFVRGRILLDQGQAGAGAEAFSRYIDRNPENPAAFLWRARCRALAGDGAGASEDYDTALRLDPVPGPDPYLERARHLRSRGPGHLEAALTGLREGLERLGSLVTLELEAVDLELALGRPDDALARLGKIADRSQRPELWRVRRAEILEGLGRRAEARAEWQAAADACARLPARLRSSPAQRELEKRIQQALGTEIPRVDPGAVPGAGKTNTALRRVPAVPTR